MTDLVYDGVSREELDDYGERLARYVARFGGPTGREPSTSMAFPDTYFGRVQLWRYAEYAVARGVTVTVRRTEGVAIGVVAPWDPQYRRERSRRCRRESTP